jgi:spore germination cell wall hydrolase CwlJ-like protein
MTFLALCIWREARGEGRAGLVAVAHSIVNRVASPTWGNTMMSVLFQRQQYSSLTHQQDPQLVVWPTDDDPTWKEALEVADGVLRGEIDSPVGKADSYHSTSIVPPRWATNERFVLQVGRHRFYRLG